MKLYYEFIIGLSLILGANSVVKHNEYVVPFGKNGASFVSETSSMDVKPGGFSTSVSYSTHSQDGGHGTGPLPPIDNNFFGNGPTQFRFGNYNGYNAGYNGNNLGFNGFNPGYNGFNPGYNGFNSGYNRYNPGYNGFNPGYNGINPGFNGFNPGFFSNPFFDFDSNFLENDLDFGIEFGPPFPPFFRNRFGHFHPHSPPSLLGSGGFRGPFPFPPRHGLGNSLNFGYNTGRDFSDIENFGTNSGVMSPYDMFRPY